MKTKTVEYWADLPSNWHTKEQLTMGSPHLNNSLLPYPAPEGWKRVKVMVELPIWGDEVDYTVKADSKIEKGAGFQQDS